MKINTNNKAFQQHIFNTVVALAEQYLTNDKKTKNITKNSYFDNDLDISVFGLCFLIKDLEEETLLNLDAPLSRVATVGDVCDLITERIQQANKQELISKLNSMPLQVKILESIKIKGK